MSVLKMLHTENWMRGLQVLVANAHILGAADSHAASQQNFFSEGLNAT
jgi:hypothetical protein